MLICLCGSKFRGDIDSARIMGWFVMCTEDGEVLYSECAECASVFDTCVSDGPDEIDEQLEGNEDS